MINMFTIVEFQLSRAKFDSINHDNIIIWNDTDTGVGLHK